MMKAKSIKQSMKQLHGETPSSPKKRPAEGAAPESVTSMRDIALSLGMSVATVSRALRNDPAVLKKTRDRVTRAAEAMGYRRNAFVGEFMSSIRKGSASHFKGSLALLWGGAAEPSERRRVQIQAGALQRAEELGYSLDEFDLSTCRPQSIARILHSRGISGVLIAVPSFSAGKVYLRFDFSNFSCVSLGWGLFRPLLHTVRFDYFQAMRLALHHSRHAFGGKIAAVWDVTTDLRSHRAAQASFVIHHPDGPARAHKLFLNSKTLSREIIRRYKIECLLLTAGVSLPDWVRDEIPDTQIVQFQHPGDKKCFAWIDTQNTLLGKWGVDLLTTKLSGHERGIPEACQVMLVPPKWCKGQRVSSANPRD